jgi:hypothetical protein
MIVESKPTEDAIINNQVPQTDTTSASEQIFKLPKTEEEKIIIEEGKTLRLVAEDKFGSREFWIYIYLENQNKIKNPNIVPVGLELFVPDASEYGINAADPQSIAKAKALGEEMLGRFYFSSFKNN